MSMEDLGYFLYMESQEQDKESTEEKVNLELNPFLVGVITTQEPK